LPPQQTDIDTTRLRQTPSPNAAIALRVKAATFENRVCIDPMVLGLEGKQLTTKAGFLAHLASQRLTVMIKLFHGHRFHSSNISTCRLLSLAREDSKNSLQSDLIARASPKVWS
jgi:hypothetical protein